MFIIMMRDKPLRNKQLRVSGVKMLIKFIRFGFSNIENNP